MKYSTDNGSKELFLNEHDLAVKENVEKIYRENPQLSDIQLSNKVENYYYNSVGISNSRLWKVIDFFCEIATGGREILDEEDMQSIKWENDKNLL